MRARISIAAKFLLTYFVITGTALAFAGLAGYFQFRAYVTEEADQSLEHQARLVAETFRPLLEAKPVDRGLLAREGDRIGRGLVTRITVVLPTGEAVTDSRAGAAALAGIDDQSELPEVREALAGRRGTAVRRSASVGDEYRYCAVPILSDGRIVGVARTAIPLSVLNRRLDRIRTITWGTGIAAFLLMLAFTALRARRITGPLNEMKAAAQELSAGNLERRVRIRTGDELEVTGAALNLMATNLGRTIGQLEAEKARLATLLENLAEGVIVIADDRTVRMMNRTAAILLGIPARTGEGHPYAGLIRHPEVLSYIDGCRRSGGAAPCEVTVHLPEGDRVVRMTATTVRYEAENRSDLLLALSDVTEERRLALVKSDFVSNASHELRTPLTSVRGYLEALDDAAREGAPVDPDFVAIALRNAIRMEHLIDDLLELSKAESGGPRVEKEAMPLSAFLERVASVHGDEAAKRGKTLLVAGEKATLRADIRKLALAVSNLVDNAIKYGIEGGTVRLGGRAEGSGVVIEVADDGPGIPPEHLPRIFERFYRVDKGRSRDLGGTGLGLSIAKHIVESHGGAIHAESRLGRGTRFLIRIPG
ncbi:MAG: ATP-binding protein [Candidatus Deferrimicrobiaceae bacterium]